MFIQVIQGKVTDKADLRRMVDRWSDELAPGATGWLGSTAGVTADDTFIALVRFESEEAARRNSERPEQDQWWTQTAKLFTGDVTFHDCRECEDMLRGDPDQAGFVQVMQGHATDIARMRELNRQFADLTGMRPDLIGVVAALHGDGGGGFTEAAYFTSEEEARGGEQEEPPPEAKRLIEEEMSLVPDMTYLDLREPWLHSPR
jgi:hypothetical protein